MKSGGGRIGTILAVGLVLLAMACIIPTPLVLLFHLLFGWIGYLSRVLPQVQINWAGVASAALSLAGVVILGHVVGSWLWCETAPSDMRSTLKWKWSWTGASIAIVVLMFTCGLAAIGITHQAVWLARSDEPMFRYAGYERANRIMCAANMQSIGAAIQLYASEHGGQLPETIEELVVSDDISARVFVCPSSNAEPATAQTPEEQLKQLRSDERDRYISYVYHGRGLKMPLPKNQVILSEPLADHGRVGMNVLFGDMTVRWLSASEAQDALHTMDK